MVEREESFGKRAVVKPLGEDYGAYHILLSAVGYEGVDVGSIVLFRSLVEFVEESHLMYILYKGGYIRPLGGMLFGRVDESEKSLEHT